MKTLHVIRQSILRHCFLKFFIELNELLLVGSYEFRFLDQAGWWTMFPLSFRYFDVAAATLASWYWICDASLLHRPTFRHRGFDKDLFRFSFDPMLIVVPVDPRLASISNYFFWLSVDQNTKWFCLKVFIYWFRQTLELHRWEGTHLESRSSENFVFFAETVWLQPWTNDLKLKCQIISNKPTKDINLDVFSKPVLLRWINQPSFFNRR